MFTAITSASSLPTPVRVPRQRRSERVLERIVDAARALFEERTYESVGIADIASRAGVSVGIFYQRFATKDHLLVHIARDFVAEMQTRAERSLRAQPSESLAGFAESYFALAAEAFHKHRAIIRPLTLVARQNPDPALREILATFNRAVHGIFREKALEHRREIRHPAPDVAINFAILAASSALRELVLYQEPVSRLGPKRRGEVARECARLFTSYLVSTDAT